MGLKLFGTVLKGRLAIFRFSFRRFTRCFDDFLGNGILIEIGANNIRRNYSERLTFGLNITPRFHINSTLPYFKNKLLLIDTFFARFLMFCLEIRKIRSRLGNGRSRVRETRSRLGNGCSRVGETRSRLGNACSRVGKTCSRLRNDCAEFRKEFLPVEMVFPKQEMLFLLKKKVFPGLEKVFLL